MQAFLETKDRNTLTAVFLIIILGFIIYANSLNGQLLWDDEFLVEQNLYIRDWSHLADIFTRDIWAGSGQPLYNYYRPLHILSYVIDYSLWGLNAFGYHLTNVILHILVALCVYWFITVLYNNKLLSLLTSILFLIHPIQTETVASVSVRGDSIAALFMLLCLIFYIKAHGGSRISFYILTLFSYILALLTKESCLILPALLLLYHYTFKRRIRPGVFIPITAIACGYLFLRSVALKSVLLSPAWFATASDRIPGFFVAMTNYIKLLILPFHLHVEYGNLLFNITDPSAILGIIICFSVLTYAFIKRRNSGIIFFSIAWFFVSLLPVSNLYPVGLYMAEHYLYFPSIGIFLLVAYGASNLLKVRNHRSITAAFLLCLIAFYSSLTVIQNNYWREPIAFYERTFKYISPNPRMYNLLGSEYYRLGGYEDAKKWYYKTLEADPDYAMAYNNIGVIHRVTGDPEGSIAFFKKAIGLNPSYVAAYNNLGIAYNLLGMREEEIDSYKQALEADPTYAETYNNLAIVYMESASGAERYAEVIDLFKKAIERNPYYAVAYYNLALAYYHVKDYESAIEYCDKATALGHNASGLSSALQPFRSDFSLL